MSKEMWVSHFARMHQGQSNNEDGFYVLTKSYKSKTNAKDTVDFVTPTEQVVEQAKLQIKKRKIKDQLS